MREDFPKIAKAPADCSHLFGATIACPFCGAAQDMRSQSTVTERVAAERARCVEIVRKYYKQAPRILGPVASEIIREIESGGKP